MKKNLILTVLFMMLFASVPSSIIAKAEGELITSSDLEVNVTAENTLEFSLSTNTINFNDYNGTKDSVELFDIMVDSSLNYDIDVKMNEEFKNILDETKIIDKSNLKIWETVNVTEIGIPELNEYVNIISNSEAGNGKVHNISLKLMGDSSVSKGDYKTTLTFQAKQR